MRRHLAVLLVGLAALGSACGGSSGRPSLTPATSTTDSPTSTTTDATTTTTQTTTTVAPTALLDDPANTCKLLNEDGVAQAGFELDEEPTIESVVAARSADDAATLAAQQMDALYNCTMSFDVAVIVWDAATPEVAAQSLASALGSASWDGRLPITPLPESPGLVGGTVVDNEVENSTVQWQTDDLHLVINLTNYRAAGMSDDEVQALLVELAEYAENNSQADARSPTGAKGTSPSVGGCCDALT